MQTPEIGNGHDALVVGQMEFVGPSAGFVRPLAVGGTAEPAWPTGAGPLGQRAVAPVATIGLGRIRHPPTVRPMARATG